MKKFSAAFMAQLQNYLPCKLSCKIHLALVSMKIHEN